MNILKYPVALLFLYAGIYKIIDVKLFISQLADSPLIPKETINFIGYALPPFEILLGLLVLFSRNMKWPITISLIQMIFFTFYLLALYFLYDKPPCACGGILANLDYPEHILLNIIFTLICLILQFKVDYENN